MKYIDYIPDIISEPDYIGVNPNEEGTSIELIKRYADNVMIGIKLDTDGNIYMFQLCMMFKNQKYQDDYIVDELKNFTLTMRKNSSIL